MYQILDTYSKPLVIRPPIVLFHYKKCSDKHVTQPGLLTALLKYLTVLLKYLDLLKLNLFKNYSNLDDQGYG